MNVYDFDGTIYYPNSTVDFAIWCMIRHPKLLFTYAPKTAVYGLLYIAGKIPKYKLLHQLFRFLGQINDFDIQIERYWDKHEKRISAWYLAQKKPDDLIISASPDCIIAPVARRLGVNFMASEYDREFNVFTNNLMFAKEKSRYIFDHGFPVIDNFYSDSLSDTPIALCAEKAFLITDKARKVNDWPDLDKKTMQKVHREIDTGTDIHLE
ncbi:MAG: haloacid dehalogenase-like hydrolase [Ruminiclostridium sp.]|nr:haloacid dehalogenase-like hydrolase [Ruminiclostridium sp.]